MTMWMKQRRSMPLFAPICLLLVVAAIVAIIAVTRRFRTMAQSNKRLAQIGAALTNYRAANGHFPPAYIADRNGKPMHSWRVLLLPYLGRGDLFSRYDMDEPWDGPHNLRLAHEIPFEYSSPFNNALDSTKTPYVAIIGKETAWPESHPSHDSDFTDGFAKTVVLIESPDSAVDWMEPRDITIEQVLQDPGVDGAPAFKSRYPDTIPALLADGTPTWLPIDIRRDVLRALLTIAGGESIEHHEDGTFTFSRE